MKYLWTLMILFAATFLLGRFSKNPTRVEQAIEAETQVFNTATTPSPIHQIIPKKKEDLVMAPSTVATAKTPRNLSLTKGGELFSYLFDTGFQSKPISSTELEQVKHRFNEKYPIPKLSKHVSPLENELKDRIGNLKATGSVTRRFPRSNTSKELKKLYQQLVHNPKENFLVRRQALRNLASVSATQNEASHRQWLRSVDPHLLATSALDEREMIEVSLEP